VNAKESPQAVAVFRVALDEFPQFARMRLRDRREIGHIGDRIARCQGISAARRRDKDTQGKSQPGAKHRPSKNSPRIHVKSCHRRIVSCVQLRINAFEFDDM
jgi:hypothetical protein